MSTVFETAQVKAKRLYGVGWERLTTEAQRNAVAFEVMALSAQQDPSVSSDRIREINETAYTEIIATYEVI